MGIGRLLFGFTGRIARGPFAIGLVGVLAVGALAAWAALQGLGLVAALLNPYGLNAGLILFGFWWLVIGVTTWAALSLVVKRLHDRGRSGWWAASTILPLALVALLSWTPLLEGVSVVRWLAAIPAPYAALRALVLIKSGAVLALLLCEGAAVAGASEPNRYGPPVAR